MGCCVVVQAGYAKQNLDAVSSTIGGLPGVLAGLFEEPQQSRQGPRETGEPQKVGEHHHDSLSAQSTC